MFLSIRKTKPPGLEEIFQSQLQLAVVAIGRGYHPEGAGALYRSRRPELGMIQSVEGFHPKIQVLPLEGHGKAPVNGQGERIVRRRYQRRRIARCASIVTNCRGEGARIEPLADRSVGDGQSLTRDQVRALERIAVVLPVRCLADPKRVAGQELVDAVDAPAIQDSARYSVSARQLGQLPDKGDGQVVALIGKS